MNIIDLIYHDIFLRKLYPEGLSNFLHIGEFRLKEAGTFELSIHTKQKPALEISKWGVYGKNFDVVVINLSGSGARNINIANWINAGFTFFDFSKEDENIRMKAQETVWTFDIEVASLSFQNCSTYIE